jgi:hypothetical protein
MQWWPSNRSSRSEAATVSTESIVNPSHSVGVADPCQACGAPMAADQRYCLECGARRAAMSSVLLGGPPRAAAGTTPAAPPAPQTLAGGGGASQQRANALTLLAGVGVLMLAMGVGVLIGRSGASKPAQSPAQVITLGSAPTATGTSATSESVQSDWPAGKAGYSVQLQALPAGTSVAAVQAAKAAASAKGAKNVGALKSEDFSSLPSGTYVIYSGDYHRRSEAQKALGALKKSFPGASVIALSNHGSSTEGSGTTGATPGAAGAGNSLNNPAPPTVLESKPKKGQSFEQKSRSLPNVISTG